MRVLFVLVSLFLSADVLAQPNRGMPFIINYPATAYKQGTQNFAVLQDQRGILYFGNSHGVLEYDGINWRLIKVSNNSEVHSLALDEKTGRIFVGAQGEFGYLQVNPENGRLQYASLLSLLPKPASSFHDVWSTTVTEEQVIFRTTHGIFLYRPDTLIPVPLASNKHRSFYLNNSYYVWEAGVGLQQLQGTDLVQVPGGSQVAQNPIHAMFPYSEDEVFVVTREAGCFIYDGFSFKPITTEIDSLMYGQNSFGKVLPDGTYAIATRSEGLLIINRAGQLLHKIDRSTGVIDEAVWDVAADRFTGDLWLALNNGISIVEINSPFTHFGSISGLYGQFYHLIKRADKLYAAGSTGLYVKDWLTTAAGRKPAAAYFTPVTGAEGQAWHFFSAKDHLLAATNRGIVEVLEQENGVKNIGFTDRAWFFLPLQDYPGYVLVNTVSGLYLLKQQQNDWQVVRKLAVPQQSFYYFAQDALGNIWVDSPTRGIFKLRFDQGIEQEPSLFLLTEAHGLPSNYHVRPFALKNEVVFGTQKGVYTYLPQKNRFVPHQKWNKALGSLQDKAIEWLEQDEQETLWFVANEALENGVVATVGSAAIKHGAFQVNTETFQKIQNIKVRDFLVVDPKNVFLATSEGIIHYNPAKEKQEGFGVLLRKIELIHADSTLHFGAFLTPEGKLSSRQTAHYQYRFPYAENNIRFSFASQSFKNPEANLYQYYLEGMDEGWGPWTSHSTKEYTNLHEGKYNLLVRSKNQYNQLSAAHSFTFRVLPPWYRSLWAYLVYSVLGVLFVVGAMRLYGIRLKNRNKRLEKIIQARTLEIRQQNHDIRQNNQQLEKAKKIIAEQYKALKKVNQRLEVKVAERTTELNEAYNDLLVLKTELDTFIYKSSHDINGPLMRLRGLCQVAAMDVGDAKALQYIDLFRAESEKSINVLHKLLTFYQVKNVEPKLEEINCAEIVNLVLKQLEKVPGSAEVAISKKVISSDEQVNTDAELLNIILYQLLENALLFRKEYNPEMQIRIKCLSASVLEIRIADNGIGIPKQVSDKIFNMFYRASEKSRGPGLGLYIARAAAAKLYGTIIYLKVGQWSVFKVRLPVTTLAGVSNHYQTTSL